MPQYGNLYSNLLDYVVFSVLIFFAIFYLAIPVGSALAGPVASWVGIYPTLVGSGLISLACILIVIAQPSVREIRSDELEPVAAEVKSRLAAVVERAAAR
mgnify:CR=1 FL=1